MNKQTTQTAEVVDPKVEAALYGRILVAVDSSDHSNHAMSEAGVFARPDGADITAGHVYAAKMHDFRFKQMEGGLPEKYLEESELERQRDVHDDLITRGLSIITDSYLDQAEKAVSKDGINFKRCSMEGKNYQALVKEANSGDYDLLVMGSLGVGAIPGSRVGTVCERTVRRSSIDTLVVKDPGRSLSEGPIVVAVDGSSRAYGGLLTALALADEWEVPVHVIAAFDPYFHYVAFNRIADVLSEEAGKIFKFKEQEKLHEEIIDSGLAKIYEGHLEVAKNIAEEYGRDIQTKLLDGKPYDAIEKYLRQAHPSLLVIGKLGIHADPELDIGGNAENLLRNVECAVLLSQREYRPRLDVIADVTTSWTKEAEERMNRAPSFVRSMARMAILRYAQQRGHTVITGRIVEEATRQLMPGRAEQMMGEIVDAHDAGKLKRAEEEIDLRLPWSDDARALLATVENKSVRNNVHGRAEKKARVDGAEIVQVEHLTMFLAEQGAGQGSSDAELHWQAEALARLVRVPEGFMRDASRKRIEDYARAHGLSEISLETAEAGLDDAREAMSAMMGGGAAESVEPADDAKQKSACPFAHLAGKQGADTEEEKELIWEEPALERLAKIPEGFMRDMTKQRIETYARKRGAGVVTADLMEGKYAEWGEGSAKQSQELRWEESALERIQRIPDFIRGMVIKEVERCARGMGLAVVTMDTLARARDTWAKSGAFHSDGKPGQYADDRGEADS